MMNKSRRLLAQAHDLIDRVEAEGREFTEEERERSKSLLAQAQQAQDLEQQFREIEGVGPMETIGSGGAIHGGPGDLFVKSAAFKKIADPASRGQQWTTGNVDVGYLNTKAGTVLESGQGAGLVPVPEVAPGVVSKLFEEIAVPDLFASATTTSNSVRYINEGTATSAAAGVAEGAAKPASDLAYSTVDEPVKKIATSIQTSDEVLEDASSFQTYLNSRLTLFVQAEEARQLLRGAGTNELVGIMGRSGVSTYGASGVANTTALATVIANLRGSAFLESDAIIMHPANWLTTRLQTDSSGQYLGGGPFTGAYGNAGGVPGLFGQSLWGKPVVLSTVVGSRTALVGSFSQAAQIFRRGGVSVEATNSHASLFLSNEVAIRAEERLALACSATHSAW